jgi:hypothetical protein
MAASSFRTCSITGLLVSLFLCLAALYTENLNLCSNTDTALESSSSSQVKTKTSSATSGSDSVHTYTNTTTITKSKSKKKLPNFANGGVVIFYHSPKTGGMTVRANFQDKLHPNDNIIHHQMLGYNGKSLQGHSKIIDGFLTQNRRDKLSLDTQVLFLELHGPTQSVLQLYTELQRWRRLAVQHDTGFFAWSLVREPLSFSVSYFNFFWASPCLFESGCPYKLHAPTEENYLSTHKPNVQCLYWSRSDVTWRSFIYHDVSDPMQTAWPVATETECQAVEQVLLQEMDWVGTTDKLSQETLPLLAYMLSSSSANVALQTEPEEEEQEAVGDASITAAAKTANADDHQSRSNKNTHKKADLAVFNSVAAQKEAVITVESLQPSTVDYIRSINTYDQAIYEAVVKEFTMDMWEDWVA